MDSSSSISNDKGEDKDEGIGKCKEIHSPHMGVRVEVANVNSL